MARFADPAEALRLKMRYGTQDVFVPDWGAAVRLVTGEFMAGFSVPDAPAFEAWLMRKLRGKLAEKTRARKVASSNAMRRTSRPSRRGSKPSPSTC